MVIARVPRVLVGAWLLVVTLPANAQDIGGVFDMGMLTGTASMDPVIEQSREMAIRKGEGDPLPGRPRAGSLMSSLSRALTFDAGATTGPAHIDAPSLTYRPSTAVRKANFARFVERSRAHDPEGSAKLAQLFKTTDVMAVASDWMKPYGLVSTNVADTTAVYLATAWLATRGRSDDPDPAAMRAVREQVASAIAAAPDFRKASDAQKQELAEAMTVQAILISQYVDAAKSQPKLMKSIRDGVATGARRTFGFDLRSMELTGRGLR